MDMDDTDDFSSYLKLINNCDQNDPLLSETTLGKRLDEIPLDHVNPKDLIKLNQALNVEQLIRTRDGLARDYRGIAELMGFTSIEIESRFGRSYNPTKSLLDAHVNKNLNTDYMVRVNDLLKMIEKIERFDVIDDLLPTLVRLVSERISPSLHPSRLALKSTNERSGGQSNQVIPVNKNSILVKDFNRLTVDDTIHLQTLYDAFICHAPEDAHYAYELISLLEEHNKRVATTDDLLPGHFEHDAIVQLIDMRCRKVIIILTPNFSKSKECEFQTKFASEIAIRAGSPKIIPVLYEACDDSLLPPMIRVISKIDMINKLGHRWQMNKLLASLDNPIEGRQRRGISIHPSSDRRSIAQQHQQVADSRDISPIIDTLSTGSQSPTVPAITLTNSGTTRSSLAGQPIVELLQSSSTVSSGSNFTCSMAETPSSPVPAHNSSSNDPSNWNWFNKFKRKVMGNSSGIESMMSPSTSSQAMLLTSSTDLLSNGFDDDSEDLNATNRQ